MIPIVDSYRLGVVPWTPAELSLAAWWDTDDAATIDDTAGAVNQIDDKSGNANHATQSGSNRPTTGTRTIGGKNVFDYVGASSQHLDFGSNIDMVDKSMWAVLRIDSLAADFTVIGGGNKQNTILTNGDIRNWGSGTSWSPTNTMADSSAVIDTDYFIGFISDSAAKQFSVDGVLNVASAGTWIGTTFNFYAIADNQFAHAADGAIGEVVIVDGNLSTDDRQKMEGYLAWKWGLEGSLPGGHPYESAPPTV